MMTFDVTGTYRPCPTCQAPIIVPFPATWTIELIKEGHEHGPVLSLFTPHAEQCDAPAADPQPGKAIRLPGRFVNDLNIQPGLPDDPIGRNRATTMHTAHDPEVPVLPDPPIWAGLTDDGTRSFTAVSDVADGQAVQIVDGEFVKPVIRHEVAGEFFETRRKGADLITGEGQIFYAPLTGGSFTEVGRAEGFEAVADDEDQP